MAHNGTAQICACSAVSDAVRRAYDMRVGDMATAASVGQSNAVNQAIGMRRSGDEAMRGAEAEAAQYRRMAKATRSQLMITGAGSLLQAAVGGLGGFSSAQGANDAASKFNMQNAASIKTGAVNAKPMQSPWKSAFMNAEKAGRNASNEIGGLSPFINNIFGSKQIKDSVFRNLFQ